MSIKSKVGDVFLIPLGERRFGIGQIAGMREQELYLVLFEETFSTANVLPSAVSDCNPILAALSLDAKLWHGHWPIVGNFEKNLPRLAQPAFKVEHDGLTFMESRDRSMSRPVNEAENADLRYRTVVSPALLEAALKAHHGIGAWDSEFDELKFDYALKSSRLASEG